MALLDWMSDVAGPVVRGDGVLLRPPRASDYAAWSALRDGSRDYLQPWEPAWPDDDLSKGAFRRRLSIYAREMELGNAWPFFVFVDGGKTTAIRYADYVNLRNMSSAHALVFFDEATAMGCVNGTYASMSDCNYTPSGKSIHGH